MIILDVPTKFQPNYKSIYPAYSSGKNMEELFYTYFTNNKDTIDSELIYLPVFWTSYYVTHGYGQRINELLNWLESLDTTKQYFTIVQYASGIYLNNFNLNIKVFSAGGGGLNLKSKPITTVANVDGHNNQLYCGSQGDFDIPLLCLPQFPNLNLNRDIFCSFMGRFDTHPCRVSMRNIMNDKIKCYKSTNFEQYVNLLNRSVFTLAPRGYGYTSFRIYEAILAGSIPIYIWEDKCILPFKDIIDWNKIAIIIKPNELNILEEKLNNINIEEYQNEIKKVRDFFTVEKTFNYIKNNI